MRPAAGIALLSLLVCGLLFPLLVAGVAQTLMPHQADGEMVKLNGRTVGSTLIAQNFTLPLFFHERTGSASGVDPDITVQAALSQIPRIHNATGIPSSALQGLVERYREDPLAISGAPYVNVLTLNLALIRDFPSTYAAFSG